MIRYPTESDCVNVVPALNNPPPVLSTKISELFTIFFNLLLLFF